MAEKFENYQNDNLHSAIYYELKSIKMHVLAAIETLTDAHKMPDSFQIITIPKT